MKKGYKYRVLCNRRYRKKHCIQYSSKSLVLNKIENYLSVDQAKEYWLLGEWERLITFDFYFLENHTERRLFVLLILGAHQQLGNTSDVRKYIQYSLKWGCTKIEIIKILVSGLYSSFGKIEYLRGAHNSCSQSK